MKRKNIILVFSLLVAGACAVGCSDQWDSHTEVKGEALSGSIYDAIQKNSELSSFATLLKNTGYDVVLSGDNNYTVLAPTNEALTAYVNADIETQRSIVRNHIAPLTYRKDKLGDKLMMVNGKNLTLADAALQDEELLCGNGIVRIADHTVEPKQSIYEIITGYREDYEMARVIYEAGDSVMDTDKSIQLGVDKETGLPYYDTVWTYQNFYFEATFINREDSLSTFILLDDANFKTLTQKYMKYMYQVDDDADSTNSRFIATRSLINDMACLYSENSEATEQHSRLLEFIPQSHVWVITEDTLKVDMSNATSILNQASNGNVLVANGVNVRMKNNKIREIVVEGEDYINTISKDHTFTRLRNYASGGRDVMLTGRYEIAKEIKTFTGTTISSTGEDSTYTYLYPSGTKSYSYTSATNDGSLARCNQHINAYLEYRPHLYSCAYQVYMLSYDDIEAHYAGDSLDLDYDPLQPNKPCTSIYRIVNKIYFGEEGKSLVRGTAESGSEIANYKSVGAARVMVGIDPEQFDETKPEKGVNAGVLQEIPLRWHNTTHSSTNLFDPVGNAATSTNETNGRHRDRLYVLNDCSMDIFVCNSWDVASSSSKNNGMIFLDYLRFVPIIDEDE